MKAFLKCYYGYKNWGDELLFFGVCWYIAQHFHCDKIYVEVEDKDFMEEWIAANKDLLVPCAKMEIECVQKEQKKKYMLHDTVKFFGGGEVLTDEIVIEEKDAEQQTESDNSNEVVSPDADEQKQAGLLLGELEKMEKPNEIDAAVTAIQKSAFWVTITKMTRKAKIFASHFFARAGWNYFVTYWRDIMAGNFVLLGGISLPHKPTTKLLYQLMLPRAKQIICREKESYGLAKKYNPNVVLFDDFGVSVVQYISKKTPKLQKRKKEPYILINVHKKIRSDDVLEKIKKFCARYESCQKIFFPCDLATDTQYFSLLAEHIHDLQLYTWTDFDIKQTLSLFAYADAGIGARLHFLLPLQEYGVRFEPLVYAEKIRKLIRLERNIAYVDRYSIKKAKLAWTISWKKVAMYLKDSLDVSCIKIYLGDQIVPERTKELLTQRGYTILSKDDIYSVQTATAQTLLMIEAMEDMYEETLGKTFLFTADPTCSSVISVWAKKGILGTVFVPDTSLFSSKEAVVSLDSMQYAFEKK